MSDNVGAADTAATVAKVAASATPSSSPSSLDLVKIVRFLISNCLSYGVVFGASILKVPQIVNVARKNSAAGISLFSNYVELLSYVISTSWGVVQGLAFRDFGENAFIFIQLIVLVLMVARLQNQLPTAIGVIASELGLFYVMCNGVVPRRMHESLLSGQILLNISSRVPQILLNYRNGSTGQLSFLTFFLAWGGGIARVLTTALNVPWEKGKAVMLAQFSVAASLNTVVIAQILYYAYKAKKSAGGAQTATRGKPSKHSGDKKE